MDITKNQIKYIKSLHQHKYRQIYKKFIGEGSKVCIDLIKSSKYDIEFIVASNDWVLKNQLILNKYSDKILLCNNAQMEQISTFKNISEVLIVGAIMYENLSILLNDPGYYFYFDDLQDPGNAGTIIRTADWFGFKGIISSASSVDFFNPKVVQSSMGSITNLHLIQAPISHLEAYKDIYNIYALDMKGQPLTTAHFYKNVIIILGNEGHGINEETRQLVKKEFFINILGNNNRNAESLNVGVAASITAFHLFNNEIDGH
jgi:TrmH family RNA methyltransferase